jgi:hypothetical protein
MGIFGGRSVKITEQGGVDKSIQTFEDLVERSLDAVVSLGLAYFEWMLLQPSSRLGTQSPRCCPTLCTLSLKLDSRCVRLHKHAGRIDVTRWRRRAEFQPLVTAFGRYARRTRNYLSRCLMCASLCASGLSFGKLFHFSVAERQNDLLYTSAALWPA